METKQLTPEQRRELVGLFNTGRHAELEVQVASHLDEAPASGFLWKIMGACLLAQGKDARDALGRSVRFAPDDPEAQHLLAVALAGAGQFEPAAACFRAAIALQPDRAESHQRLGAALIELAQPERALDSLGQALRLQPDYVEALGNQGVAQVQTGDTVGAIASFRRALLLKPDYTKAEVNLGLALLKQGDFAQGWLAYRARTHMVLQQSSGSPARLPAGQWQGEALDGKTILVWREQGLGDEIQFCRYASELKRRGAHRVILACRPPMAELFSTVPGVDAVFSVDPQQPALPPCDYWTMLLDLPWHCATRLDTIPAALPYLQATPARIERARSLLAPFAGLKIGVCWRGNPRYSADAQRSIPLARFAPLFRLPGMHFVSLVPDSRAEFVAACGGAACNIDAIPASASFADTAGLLMALDLVVTCDTAVAHLAGALGRPTWLLLPLVADWRWLEQRADTPWYPTMRLLRQQRAGDWDGVLQHVAAGLAQLQAGHQASPPC